MGNLLNKWPLFLLSFGLWIVLGGLDVLQWYAYVSNSGETFKWLQNLSHTVPYFVLLWLFSPVVYHLYLGSSAFSWKKKILLHLPMSMLFGVLIMILNMAAMTFIRSLYGTPEQQTAEFWEAFTRSVQMAYSFSLNGFTMYWVILLILLAIDFYGQYRNQEVRALELESKLTTTQLRTLKWQLQPHFLFNALNTIAMMVRRKKDEEAVEMISGLSDLLRSTLNRQEAQLITLGEEIELLKKYLHIEQVRFKDKLTMSFHLQPETLSIQVPNLILQPIVENAFKYGISRSLDEAGLSILSTLSDDFLHVSVVNLGPTLPEGWVLEDQQGIGLSNTIARLRQLYDDSFDFQIKNVDDSGVAVEIKIPRKV